MARIRPPFDFQQKNVPVPFFITSRFIAGVLLVTAAGARGSERRPSVEAILAEAIEVQRAHEEAGNEAAYDFEIQSITEKLDKKGEVRKVEKELFENHPIDGVPYQRLVLKDGRELTDKERKKEDKREKKFRATLAKGKEAEDETGERVHFNEELLSRFDIAFDSTRALDSRQCYVLSFAPKPGKLPQRRRIDRVLNKAEGFLWVDTDTYQIARIEFDLREKVKLWWGVLGSVSKMSGRLERRPVSMEVWLPSRFDFYMKARVLFRSLHFRQKLEWAKFHERKSKMAETPETSKTEGRK